MNRTKLQAQIVREMKDQGVEKKTINGIMDWLTTEHWQKQMMDYLKETRNQEISESQLIMKALQITHKLKMKN